MHCSERGLCIHQASTTEELFLVTIRVLFSHCDSLQMFRAE